MIKLIKSTFYDENSTKRKLVSFIKNAKQLSFGPQCQAFEENFKDWQKRKHCIFVNSGSSANLALIQALLNLGRLKKGDRVGFSALSWSTNVMPLIELGLTPVPVDVELDTLNISSKKVNDVLKNISLKALFITNLLGLCDDIEKIKQICKRKNIILLEDNCESLGTVYKGKLLGNYSLASTFSFYVGHHMSTIEGGAVCTDDKELATMLGIVRAHGWDRNLNSEDQKKIRNKHKINSTFYSRYTFYDLGYNLRPTEINGFIGNIQIKFLKTILEKRNKNFFELNFLYNNSSKYYPIRTNHIEFLSSFAIPFVCRSVEIRDKLIKNCNNKIEVRPIVGGDLTSQPFYIKYAKSLKHTCPNSKLIHEQGFYIGNNPELTTQEIRTIISILA